MLWRLWRHVGGKLSLAIWGDLGGFGHFKIRASWTRIIPITFHVLLISLRILALQTTPPPALGRQMLASSISHVLISQLFPSTPAFGRCHQWNKWCPPEKSNLGAQKHHGQIHGKSTPKNHWNQRSNLWPKGQKESKPCYWTPCDGYWIASSKKGGQRTSCCHTSCSQTGRNCGNRWGSEFEKKNGLVKLGS